MSDSKKATKFTKLIAKQLKDVYSDGYDKEELKSSLEEAVKNIPKKEIIIKTEIQKNLGRYVRKLEKFLKAQIQDVQEKGKKTFFPYNLFKDDGSEIEKTENLTKDEKEVLVNNLIAERVIKKPEVMSMVDDLPSELDTFHQLSGCHRLLKLTSGYKHAESLRQIMLKYFRNIQPVAEDILTNTDEKRSEELAKEIKNFVTTCHLRNEYCSETGEKKTPSYEDILSSLLSLYVDLKILSSRSVNSTKKKGKQFCGFIVYLLPCQHHQLDLLLNLTVLTQRDADLVLPLSRIILKWNKDNNDYKYYLKYVLAVRSIHDKLAECVSDIFESTKAIPAPKKFMSWLKEQDDELANTFPSDKRFKKIVVTRYLLEDVTEEQIDELLEIFVCKSTDDEEEMEIGEVCSAAGQQTEDKLGPQSFCIDTVGDKSHPEESDELFFIDKLGGSSKEKIIDLEVEGQFENEDESFDTMETDDKENSEKESGHMDTEVFVIDSSNFIGKKYDKNLRNIEENEGKRTFGNNTKTEEVMFGRKSERNKSVQNDEITNTLQNKKISNSREYISEEDRSGKPDDNRLKLDEEESETSMNKAKIHKTTSCTSEKPKAEELKLKEHDMQINVNVISQAEKQNSASKTNNLYSVEGSPKKRESPVMSERKREKKDLNSFQEESMEESDNENLFDGYLPALNCSEKSNVGNPGKMNVFSPGKSKIGSPQKSNVGTPQKRDVGSSRKGPRKHSIEEEGVNSEDSVGIRKKSAEDSENKVITGKRTRKTSLRSNQNELAKAIIMDSNISIGKTSLKTNKDSSEIGSIDVNVVGHDVLKDSETDTDFVLNLSVDDSDSDPEVVFNLSNGVDTATKSKLKNNQDNVTELSLVIENQGTTKNTDEGDEKSKCTSGLNFSDEKLSSDMSEEAKTGDVNVRKLRRSRHLSEAVGTCHTHEGRHSKHIAEVCTMCQKNNKGDGTSRSRKPVDQENGQKADVKEKIKRRKSEPLSLKTVESKKRRKSEAAITPRKGMRLRTRKL